jgi:hypothetical protein
MILSKEKLISLNKYLTDMKNKLEDVNQGNVPKKHENNPVSYKLFLVREIGTVQKQLEHDKLERTSKD